MWVNLVLSFVLGVFLVSGEYYHEGVELLGRFNSDLQADWSGAGIRFQVKAFTSKIEIDMGFKNTNSEYYIGVDANCEEKGKFAINSASSSLKYEQNVSPGETYEFTFRKLTEASWQGVVKFGELNVSGGRIVSLTKEKKNICGRKYKMLAIGDSITCGYGVDGELASCPFTTSTEDVRHGYASLVAKDIQADIQTVSWSGKGVVRNYGDVNQMSVDPFPIYYNRTLANLEAPSKEDNYWSPEKYIPDLITIMLGTNDYSTQPNPTDEQYINGLINFIHQIQYDYPKAKIAAMCSPMSKNTPQCPNIESATKATQTSYIDIPESVFSGGYGCDWHPNQQTQRNMADYIIPFAKEILGEN